MSEDTPTHPGTQPREWEMQMAKIEKKSVLAHGQNGTTSAFKDFCTTLGKLEVGESFLISGGLANTGTITTAIAHATGRKFASKSEGGTRRIGRVA